MYSQSDTTTVSSDHEIPLVPIRTTGTQTPLFMVPGVMWDPEFDYELPEVQFMIYARFIKALGDDRPVYGLPTINFGLTSRSVEQLASKYVDAILSFRPEGPYLLTGFCLGGIFAYETARQLSTKHSDVKLILFDAYYPDDKGRGIGQAIASRHTWRRLKALVGKTKKAFDIIRVNGLDLRRTLSEISAGLLSASKHEISSENKSSVNYNTNMTHLFGLFVKYHPSPFHGDMAVVATEETVRLGVANGWAGVVKGAFHIHHVPGNQAAAYNEYVGTAVELINKTAE